MLGSRRMTVHQNLRSIKCHTDIRARLVDSQEWTWSPYQKSTQLDANKIKGSGLGSCTGYLVFNCARTRLPHMYIYIY